MQLLGEIRLLAGETVPRGWTVCNGQLHYIADHPDLFAVIGNKHGGDGTTTFGLPDARGRSFIGSGMAPGLGVFNLGDKKSSPINPGSDPIDNTIVGTYIIAMEGLK